MKFPILLLLFFCYSCYLSATPQDSIGIERKNGKIFILHKVTVGETLRQISKKYKTTIYKIALQNANLDSNMVKIGQVLYIPTNLINTTNSTNTTNTVNSQKPTIHIVKQGETLSKVANLYKKSMDSLLLWNNLAKNSFLNINQSLIVGYGETKNIVTENMISQADKKKIIHEVGKGERISTNSDSKFVLHRSFPIGAIILLINPTNRLATQAKVIGRIPDIDINREIIIKISDAACKELSIVNDRFAIEMVYEKL
jgi:LysM repeat protein